jgi:hypothetical protein
MSRRDVIKSAGLAGAATLFTAPVSSAQTAGEKPTAVMAKNPYGGVPSGGITLPPYYRPTPYLKSNNVYYPGQEEIGTDEMRISFIGSTPIPVTRTQAKVQFPKGMGRWSYHGNYDPSLATLPGPARMGQRCALRLGFAVLRSIDSALAGFAASSRREVPLVRPRCGQVPGTDWRGWSGGGGGSTLQPNSSPRSWV